jgi:ABC-type branched-subunit amino acid transport system substrate-binding protein
LKKKGVWSRRAAVGKRGSALGVLLVILLAGLAAYSFFASQSPTQTSTSTGSPTCAPSTICIGFLTELSGSALSNAYAARIGAELAVNATNAAGGVDGKNVSLVVADAYTNPQIALQQASVLDQQTGVLAITGPVDTNDAIAVRGYAEAHGVPFVSSTVASAALTAPGSNWTVSVEPDPVQMGAAVAKYVSQVVPGPKIALMTQNAETQKEMAAGVRWYADTFKNESVVFDQVFSNAQFPWATPAAAAKFSGANAVVVSWVPTTGFSEVNVIEALLSAGFLQNQIFVVSATNQVSDLGTSATGIRGATLFDGALANGNPKVSAFVNEVEPFIKGQANPYIAYCGICPTEVGSNYYYAYLGMELIISAIKNVLSSGHVLTRADFMSSLKQASIQDVFGNTLSFDARGSSRGLYNLVAIGQPNADGSAYDMNLLRSAGFAAGTVPAYQIAKQA